jgi:hypothetical protein
MSNNTLVRVGGSVSGLSALDQKNHQDHYKQ